MLNTINQYQLLVNETIPISAYMQWQIIELTDKNIVTKTQLKPNINVHGTGFAGSIYSAAMASGWTLLKFWYDSNQFQTTLLAAEANIKYLAPVSNDFFCHAKIESQNPLFDKLVQRLEHKTSCSYPLEIEVICNSKVCAILNVLFVFKC